MILVQHTVISDDIAENFFVCDLEKCKGACCVEGDLGAPLEARRGLCLRHPRRAGDPQMWHRAGVLGRQNRFPQADFLPFVSH